ncbi:MAG: hypothetical protein DWI08_04285 [Planctomycetota bacterium]|nr:MAG: hypothetical protein DWI08_04285 [Planctomycetota bacterium]
MEKKELLQRSQPHLPLQKAWLLQLLLQREEGVPRQRQESQKQNPLLLDLTYIVHKKERHLHFQNGKKDK